MRYPTLSADEVERLFDDLLSEHGTHVDVARGTKWTGSGEDLDLRGIVDAAEALADLSRSAHEAEGKATKDGVEGQGAQVLYEALKDVALEVLDDPGFWRYLAMVHLWEFIRWREPSPFDEKDFEKARVYLDGKRNADCVPLRMFTRGRIAAEAGDPALATAAPSATDLWRSHIVRVRTAYTPKIAAALIRQQADADRRLSTDAVRAQARRINRFASNVVLHSYDEREAEALLEELRMPEG